MKKAISTLRKGGFKRAAIDFAAITLIGVCVLALMVVLP